MPLELCGLQAWITCDDDELPQYQVQQDGDKSISCYIPSEAGKAFAIRYKGNGNGLDQSDICIDVFIDGRYVNGVLNSPDELHKCCDIKGKTEGSALYPFVFAAVHTHEEEASSSDDLSQLGLVEIKVFRVKINEYCEPDNPTTGRIFSSEIGVPERSKLAGYNCTMKPVERTVSDVFGYTDIDSVDDPFCVFRFRHLPREMLQARGIIPQDAPPGPAHAESPDVHKKRKRKQEEKSSKRSRPLEPSSSGAAATTVQVKEEVASEVQVKIEPSAEGDAERSSAADDVRIRALENTLQTSHNALLASQQALQASQDALRTIQMELEELKGRRAAGPSTSQCKVERRPSPIRVGSFDGQIIDLTSD